MVSLGQETRVAGGLNAREIGRVVPCASALENLRCAGSALAPSASENPVPRHPHGARPTVPSQASATFTVSAFPAATGRRRPR